MRKGVGPNSISARFIRLAPEFFMFNMVKLANLSFDTSLFPDNFKLAQVAPIFKKGDSLLVQNYRPVSVLNNFSKGIEFAAKLQIIEHLDSCKLLYEGQRDIN